MMIKIEMISTKVISASRSLESDMTLIKTLISNTSGNGYKDNTMAE